MKTIFGHRLENHAHVADVIRLEALLEFGGVYFDTDVLALSAIDDFLDSGKTSLAVAGGAEDQTANVWMHVLPKTKPRAS